MPDNLKTYPNVAAASEDLLNCLRFKGSKNICLVTGRSSFTKSGTAAWLPLLTKEFAITHIETISADVKSEDVNTLLEKCEGCTFDLMLAIGGGSVIDMAKLLALFIANPPQDGIAEYLKSPVLPVNSPLPIIAVPLTAGTGSECTPFAVAYHDRIKYSVDLPQLIPVDSFLVGSTLKSLSQQQRAQTAIDAFAQAIESFWNVHSTEESDQYARGTIELMVRDLKDYLNGNNTDSLLANMHKASHMAGKAIAITRTTAPHALSYPMNSFFNIPHGIGVALTLGEFFEFNVAVTPDDCNDERGVEHVQERLHELFKLLGVRNADGAKKSWQAYMQAGGLSCSLVKYGISSNEDVAKIMEFGFNPARMRNNPRTVDAEWVQRMLCRLLNEGEL